jgi:hypothetical protein
VKQPFRASEASWVFEKPNMGVNPIPKGEAWRSDRYKKLFWRLLLKNPAGEHVLFLVPWGPLFETPPCILNKPPPLTPPYIDNKEGGLINGGVNIPLWVEG